MTEIAKDSIAEVGFKASETLLGIETRFVGINYSISNFGFKASETLLGIETMLLIYLGALV